MADAPPPVVSAETHDISAAPKRSVDDLKQDRHFRAVKFYAALFLTGLAVIVALLAAFQSTDTEVNEWGRNLLSAILGAVVGFVFAKK